MDDATTTRRRFLALGGATAVAGIAGCNALDAAPDASQPDAAATEDARGSETRPQRDADSPYTAVFQETIDSVVLVQAGRGQGTGFVFDDSHVVTNAHVAGDASTVDVRFNEGRWSAGEVRGSDPHSDLAVVSVDDIPSSAPALPFIEGPAVVGQEVVAIGNPFNLDGSLTTGVVSGTDRSIPAPTGYQIPDAIQTDAAVNPGNSGGPLMSLDSRIVAVINSGGGDNIAFGISAALTQRVVPELIETGDYAHPYLGVSFSNVTPAVADANGLSDPRGLLVVETVAGGPAEGVLQPSSGTRVVDRTRVRMGGDIILAIEDQELATPEDLGSYLALHTRPGETVSLRIVRDGTEQTVDVQLGTRPT